MVGSGQGVGNSIDFSTGSRDATITQQPMASNRLLGNRQAFLNQTNQVTNFDDTKHAVRTSVMTKSTANSDHSNLPPIKGAEEKVIINVEDPNADL